MVYLNTKTDFYNYLYDCMPCAVQELQNLLNNRFIWKVVAVLDNKTQGQEDDTHKVVESENEILQYELKEDENAELFRLGFTVEEAEKIIENPEQALQKYREQLENEDEE